MNVVFVLVHRYGLVAVQLWRCSKSKLWPMVQTYRRQLMLQQMRGRVFYYNYGLLQSFMRVASYLLTRDFTVHCITHSEYILMLQPCPMWGHQTVKPYICEDIKGCNIVPQCTLPPFYEMIWTKASQVKNIYTTLTKANS